MRLSQKTPPISGGVFALLIQTVTPRVIGNRRCHRLRQNAGLVETSVCQMGAFCERFVQARTLRLPEYKALPIMGPLIALGIGAVAGAECNTVIELKLELSLIHI